METVNTRKVRYNSSKKSDYGKEEITVSIGDNLFSLMLITFAAIGVWAVSAVLLL